MGRLLFFGAAALVFFAPLLRGGNRQAALAALVLLGLGIIALVVASATFASFAGKSSQRLEQRPLWWWALVVLLLAAPAWLGALQLGPLSGYDWARLPGRDSYLAGWAAHGLSPPAHLPMTLNAGASWASLWAGVPLAAAALAALVLPARDVPRLFGVVIAAAAVQVIVTVVQYAQGPDSLFYFDTVFPSPFLGTFSNRNHLAILFGLSIPLWFALLAVARSNATDHAGRAMTVLMPLWYLLGFSFLMLLLATQSRGGLLAACVAFGASLLVYFFGQRIQLLFRQWFGLGVLAVLFVSAAVLTVGSDRVTERFAAGTLRTDAEVRNQLTASTIEAARLYWPWGSGAGTFESVFPRFQDVTAEGTVPYAHNDYAQMLMEFGAPAVLFVVMLALLVLHQLWCLGRSFVRQGGRWRDVELHQCFAGIGVLAVLLHSRVEFNLHIPALAIITALLLGVFLRPLHARDR